MWFKHRLPALTYLLLLAALLLATLAGCAATTDADEGTESAGQALTCSDSATKKFKAKGDECQALRFSCPTSWDPFVDDCGCGCKLDTCKYGEKKYTKGQKFVAVDSCSVCTCGKDGAITCDDSACSCNPAREPTRAYIGTPEQCRAGEVPFTCPSWSTFFKSDCGCGCEEILAP